MAEVYALLVAIDRYLAVPPLRGCVNDILDAERYLAESVDGGAHVERLTDGRATRAGIIDGFRRHLGRAGAGDTALFWFSGHGSTAPVPPEWWHLEPGGAYMQTLVCADSRHDGIPDLLDKELAHLIGEVAGRGAHVVAVLDCCHSGGATRTPQSILVRHVVPAAQPPDPATLDAVVRKRVGAGRRLEGLGQPAGHVALAACHDGEQAYELPDRSGVQRGVFSAGLLERLRRPGEARTYRELIAAVRAHVEDVIDRQTPTLYPVTASIVDQPFLGGLARAPVPAMTMRALRSRWVVDAGACHGLTPGAGHGATRFAVHGSDPVLQAMAVHVGASRTVVEPVGWVPDRERLYPVVLSRVALPAITVAVGGGDGDDEGVAAAVRSAIATASPGGGPSPHLRLVERDNAEQRADLLVATPPIGDVTVHGSTGVWLASAPTGGREIVRSLEHIAQWKTLRRLANPLSTLAGAVRLEVIAELPGDVYTPRERAGIQPGPDGAVQLEYEPYEYGFRPPSVFLRLDNLTDRRLYCVVLDLTDRFRVHTGLFPGDFIEPRASAAVGEGHPIEARLPEDRLVKPGARVRDWLMLIVSEERVDSACFALPRLGEPPDLAGAARAGRDSAFTAWAGGGAEAGGGEGRIAGGDYGFGYGIVEWLALAARRRDLQRAPATARDWWTRVTPMVTRVPGDEAPCR